MTAHLYEERVCGGIEGKTARRRRLDFCVAQKCWQTTQVTHILRQHLGFDEPTEESRNMLRFLRKTQKKKRSNKQARSTKGTAREGGLRFGGCEHVFEVFAEKQKLRMAWKKKQPLLCLALYVCV